MIGSKRRGMVLQERDLRVLRELGALQVADRALVKVVAGFGSTTRVNTRLLALVRAGLIRRFRMGPPGAGQKFVYSLSRKGAQSVGVSFRGPRRPSNEPLVADLFVEHRLAINRVYSVARYGPHPSAVTFLVWRGFFEPIIPSLRLIPDGYLEFEIRTQPVLAAFVEVDLGHEVLRIWRQKVERYLQLAVSGEFEQQFGHKRFRVLVLASSERRLTSLRKATAGVTDRVFWFATLDEAYRDGLFSPIWHRPVGTERLPLVGNMP